MRNHTNETGKGPQDPVAVFQQEENPEALFAVAEIRELGLAAHHHRPSVSDFLAHEVARNPGDLRRHIQRISLFLSKRDGPGSYGAILDLFIALGDKGIKLRRRMLRLAAHVLSKEHRRALEAKLQTGLSQLDRVPLSSESILGKGIRGNTRLVDRLGLDDRSSQDLLEEARSRIEYGQVDEARRVLEDAVLQNPVRGDLHRELLEIYVHSRDYEHFGSMFRVLRSTDSPIPPAWQRLADSLGIGDAEPASADQVRPPPQNS